MKKISKIVYISIILCMSLFSCNEVLDKENLTAVNPTDVWSNANIANAYLNKIYLDLMPKQEGSQDNSTDEMVPFRRQSSEWMSGTATFDTWDKFKTYDDIREVNIILDNIDAATFDAAAKAKIKGQALFWRAWAYHILVKGYGGVPLILTAQAPTEDFSSLEVPRSKTSECVTQILKDLDDAIALLPDSWSGTELGNIDKGAALAFKGRVLLFYASPLFNGLNGVASWQKAYDANKAAKDFLDARGNGLYAPYSKIWDNELNKEAIMFKRYNYPQETYLQFGVPLAYGNYSIGNNCPSLELVNSFPMKDGSKWDPNTMSYDKLFENRDDRFYANIYYNGSPNQYLAGMRAANTYLWSYYNFISNPEGPSGIEGAHNQVTFDPLASNSSFYNIKAVDKTVVLSSLFYASVDWLEIRYTEVLMNFGECANELNKTTEALDVLYKVRERAGVLAGAGTFGITATSQADIRDIYKNERLAEFCFENKRLDDLRRWKMFDYLRGLPQRHGVAIVLKPGETDVMPLDDINVVWNKFTTTVIKTDRHDIAIQDQYYIYGIPKAVLDRNSKLEQSKDWGGTFDPLQ